MKASELITKLQELVDEHGDMEVYDPYMKVIVVVKYMPDDGVEPHIVII